MTKLFAAMTTVRNDDLFLPKWIDHYGRAFGHRHLYVFLDGHDQEKPDCEGADQVNFLYLPHQPMERVGAMRRRARVMSALARGLYRYFDSVLACDVDEFLVVDPNLNTTLAGYLSLLTDKVSVSGLGLDVGQHMVEEGPLDPSRPFLDQRRYAHLSARYTKPITTFRPVTWGSGMHRIKGHGFRIDPNLFTFHFGMVDYERSTGKTLDKDRLATGWGGHLERREALFKIITEARAHDGDTYFPTARQRQRRERAPYALNKPGMLKDEPVVTIPDRFRGLI
ncbi:hypothetical protein XMM379_000271 [Aliiroseovarius sp. xm-m-379]|uniref:glycosyltransferase family 2 protein n=1 Tax=unclassified Aliiroseovarius TaxID=2623558 RepID=UPI00156A0664|nr:MULTISPECIES: glycosyltransferase family 2 protein [unclassified Aliiroseovarius]NRP14116.1 hypothetical protein [Aliiroseovarius sp. xm-d-517]NRP23600.1 hypothetical protein [Aliiroseovarius sp. xm-m-379]NRP29153.1 hypothetical protein [Aliiroseovarius sp. xm-m-314]NRP32399.1 hypothetical protein [Aliiroseovarius sp. xm-a-104]NRP40932.1 hypothetical protein [Aliiroseovarius sp. xm-m-339-2]